ncbi:MAG: BamA/TamA family outer membrane protein, partial [SAR324 cluster bacterium]
PGLGTGLLFVGNFGNILDTTTDIAAIGGIGDAEFIFTFLDELFLAPDLLYLQYLRAHGFKFALQQYSSRGMNTSKNDFKYGIGNSWDLNAPTLKLTFMDRMLEIGLGINKQSGTFQKFVNPDESDPTKQGETVAIFDPGLEINIANKIEFSTRIDFTDDYKDPRRGIRNSLFIDRQTAKTSSEPSFDVVTNDLQIYIPVLEKSTIVFDLQISDAYVTKKGETNLEVLRIKNGGNENLTNAELASNTNGTSLSLGGGDRLRSFPEGRFQGAHTIYYAAEFRWNYSSSGGEKLDLFFIQDLVEELQVALFFEQGSVSEAKSELGKTVKTSVGSGFRFLSGSGNLYRADFATGNEGPAFSVIIQYPWTYRL